MVTRLLAAIAASALLAFAAPASAQDHAPHVESGSWSFNGPFGKYDRGAVQRGFLVYQMVCASCHALDHMAYRHLGEEGGPFAAYRVVNEETGQREITLGLHGGHAGALIPAAENPFVRSIAAAAIIPDIDRDTGEVTERPGRASDRFHRPYANDAAARAANGGAFPPDLSVIVPARAGGADYVRAILLDYTGEMREGRYVNTAFAGELIGMPPPLTADDMVTYSDGTPATREQMASDVTHFLQWAGDPHMEARNKLGLMVLIYLIVLTGLVYLSYKQVWRGTKH